MDAKTLKALRKSIAKWEKNTRIRKIGNAKTDARDCPLCELYLDDACDECPVSEKTKHIGCYGTPYIVALDAYMFDELPAFRKAAKAEVVFLKSLLPES